MDYLNEAQFEAHYGRRFRAPRDVAMNAVFRADAGGGKYPRQLGSDKPDKNLAYGVVKNGTKPRPLPTQDPNPN